MRPRFLVSLLLILFFFPAFSSAETYTCLVCHSAMKQKIKKESGAVVDLFIDEERFTNSVHGFASCDTCHKLFSENPHQKPVRACLLYTSDVAILTFTGNIQIVFTERI